MAEIVRPHTTVADKIRALASAGVPRADIARFLGKRYQHVRNVLEGDALAGPTNALGRADLSGVREADRPFQSEPAVDERPGGRFRLEVRPDGWVFLPQKVRETLNLTSGGSIMARLGEEEFTLVATTKIVREVQEMAHSLVKPGVSIVDELIADRRKEAAREQADD
jgi:hypothetical protein